MDFDLSQEQQAFADSVRRLARDKLEELATALIEVETLEGDILTRILGPAEGKIMPGNEPTDVSAPPSPTPAADGDKDEERPQGRPSLAWGQQSNAAPPVE